MPFVPVRHLSAKRAPLVRRELNSLGRIAEQHKKKCSLIVPIFNPPEPYTSGLMCFPWQDDKIGMPRRAAFFVASTSAVSLEAGLDVLG